MQFENILQRASFCKVHCNKPLNYNVLVIRNVSTLWGAEKACAFKSAVKNIYLYTKNIVIDIITLKSFICVSCKLNVRVLVWLLSETGFYHNNFSGIQWFSKFLDKNCKQIRCVSFCICLNWFWLEALWKELKQQCKISFLDIKKYMLQYFVFQDSMHVPKISLLKHVFFYILIILFVKFVNKYFH